ncbi:hypothetical protein IMCC3317_00620 [Kordia antarctica]|uniref:Uncharacterized protein n=1 Tax=Kordia antarctica TaxID=1218801 RepID=A0A7L4ZDS5_9FLAO|nr:hypothetical protein [Kordia antarctica]QHI34719.1 hypothetical protein IMCC3317_00620 [Kordia antarctica]
MKKKDLKLLKLNKNSISSFEDIHVLGGATGKCNFSIKRLCSSQLYQDCTVTYDVCVTMLRFSCGQF